MAKSVELTSGNTGRFHLPVFDFFVGRVLLLLVVVTTVRFAVWRKKKYRRDSNFTIGGTRWIDSPSLPPSPPLHPCHCPRMLRALLSRRHIYEEVGKGGKQLITARLVFLVRYRAWTNATLSLSLHDICASYWRWEWQSISWNRSDMFAHPTGKMSPRTVRKRQWRACCVV